MSIFMTLRIALKALNRNKMRTVLTMLGMIIGVGSVIAMVGLGRGAQSAIEEQVKSAGTNMININAGNFSQGGVRQGQGMSNTLMPEDAEAIRSVQLSAPFDPPRRPALLTLGGIIFKSLPHKTTHAILRCNERKAA